VRYEAYLNTVNFRKYDYETGKMPLKIHYIMNDEEYFSYLEISVRNTSEMVADFLEQFNKDIHNKIATEGKQVEIEIANESLVRQQFHNYLNRLFSEKNGIKKKKSRTAKSIPSYLDIYPELRDISFLPRNVQFFLMLNWAKKYYDREDYHKAIDPLRKLIKLKPEYGLGYKMLARSLKKNRKYDEAMRYYEKYAKVDKSLDARLDLAKSYRKGKLFDKSEKIYQNILQDFPEDKEARIGIAQIKYAQDDPDYLTILELLHEEDATWLKKWLIEEFNFRIYVSSKTSMKPNQAARYLGYDKPYQLTQMAFRNEVPSHFNPTKARISFYKEELDNWAKVCNRFKLLPKEIKLYPDAIANETFSIGDIAADEPSEEVQNNGKKTKTSTRVEEILKKIREAKAKRLEANGNLRNNIQIAIKNNNLDGKDQLTKEKRETPGTSLKERKKEPAEAISEIELENIDQTAQKTAAMGKTVGSNKKRKKTTKNNTGKKTVKKSNTDIDIPSEAEFILETEKN
jgi:tetratricopeptide (TPR) repeat protein